MTLEPRKSQHPPAQLSSLAGAASHFTLTAEARERFLRSKFNSPIERRRAACALYGLEDDKYFSIVRKLKAHTKEAYSAAWNSRRAKLNKSLFLCLGALLKHADFAFGGRVALTAEVVREVVDGESRNVTYLLGKLASFPDLVRVVRVKKGELGWDGTVSKRSHNEFELGAALRLLAQELLGQPLLGRSVATVSVNTRNGDVPIPATVAADPDSDLLGTLNLKTTVERPFTDQLNFRHEPSSAPPTQLPPATERPASPHIPTQTPHPEVHKTLSPALSREPSTPPLPLGRGVSHDTAAPRPNALIVLRPLHKGIERGQQTREPDAKGLSRPLAFLARVLRHVLALGPNVRLHPDEFYTVDGALRCLPGHLTEHELLKLVDRVLKVALDDHARARAQGRTDRERPSLDYIFGNPDSPDRHKFFLERVAVLREQDEQTAKKLMDSELASRLFGMPAPAKPRSPMMVHRPPRDNPSSNDNVPIPLLQLAALLDAKREELAGAG